jgi:hypothetical protein
MYILLNLFDLIFLFNKFLCNFNINPKLFLQTQNNFFVQFSYKAAEYLMFLHMHTFLSIKQKVYHK